MHREILAYGSYPPSQGVRLPPGTYALEAEDQNYWYFRAAADVEFRFIQKARIDKVSLFPGGIMFAKQRTALPFGVYIDGADLQKTMVWEFGSEFITLEGKYWSKNF